jgi:hypothetical protein
MQAQHGLRFSTASKREGRGPIYGQAQLTLASGNRGLSAETQPIVTPQTETYKGTCVSPRSSRPYSNFPRRHTIAIPATTTAAPPANNPAIIAASRTSAAGVPRPACPITNLAASHPTPKNTANNTTTRTTFLIPPLYFLVTVAGPATAIPSPSAAFTVTPSNFTFAYAIFIPVCPSR